MALAHAAHLASLEAAFPKLETMAGLAERAGLLSAGVLLGHIKGKAEEARTFYEAPLSEKERCQAREFC